ncbi:uncharacterized protein EI90DRAFT_3153002 [Cantharellus anzutake]|uniref:uncharacterized protein n=1 Tax=Cantharellus anzutake TaxID=1750568 RepID=UPI001907F9DA|nr:uncharacterized protein EI90DRAFT_3153002 [Cantharellus anzutake]KAF8335389.1 hypothetical protein EI90DRAFT_3153002 [Cantharellus anzutake]
MVYIPLSLNFGWHSEALPFIEGSAKLAPLVAIHPGSSLGVSLTNRYLDGSPRLSFIEECIRLRRQLVSVHPGSYILDSTASLDKLSSPLTHSDGSPKRSRLLNGSSSGASLLQSDAPKRSHLSCQTPAPASHSSSRITHTIFGYLTHQTLWRPLQTWTAHRSTFVGDSVSQSPLVWHHIQTIEESVELWRQLVVLGLELYTPKLARSLYNLHSALSDLEWDSEALPYIEECVGLYRQLDAARPGSLYLDISLDGLRDTLSNLGRDSKASMVGR